ncbi:MAG: response regulator [Synergistaceae bacterium]|nr:response regulator [Synergistaceae bacterium]
MLRMRIILVIVSIVAVIAISSTAAGLFVYQNEGLKTIEGDMVLVREIADNLLSREIALLKANLNAVATLLNRVSDSRISDVLKAQTEINELYLSLALLNRDERTIVSYGTAAPLPDFFLNKYCRRAFEGEQIISTTETAPNGELVFRICVPSGDRVLVGTISGYFFSDIISKFKIWQTGSIFILDESGTFIAHGDRNIIRDRWNFIKRPKLQSTQSVPPEDEKEMRKTAAFHKRMTEGEKGVGRYNFLGFERICAYSPISSSKTGWSLGVAAPIAETPITALKHGLLLTGGVFLLLGILAAVFAANQIARPIQKIDEQNVHLEELRETAERASRAKSDFLAGMSHEMRTPLNAIIGLSELALTDASGQESEDYLKKIHNAGRTLLGTINDILDISKIESGKFELIPAVYDVPSLINDTAALNVIRIGGKPVRFHLHLDETLPVSLLGDELRIRQIFNNLLSNAFKYTKEGTVDWYIACEREGEDLWLISEVRDSGIGIRKEDLERLFSDYSQVDTKLNKFIEGTGLGLSITKRLTELMDGTITVESEYGRGSVFRVRLRQKFVSDEVIGEAIAQNLRSFRYADTRRDRNSTLVRISLPHARVLVVDDVPTNLDVAKGMMKPYGMHIDCVTSGQKAVELVRKADVRYSAIFMDHMMPEMDGVEATQIIRSEIGSRYAETVPIIALTANALIGSEEKFLEKGFQAFLSKPIDIMRLDQIIRQWVRDKGYRDQPEQIAPSPIFDENSPSWEKPGRKIRGVDLEKALSLFGGDEKTLMKVLRSYVLNTPHLLEQARLHQTADDLSQYIIAVHGIKGSSYSISADEAGRRAEYLEHAAREGDRAYLAANGESFIALTEQLIKDLSRLLAQTSESGLQSEPRIKKGRPDEELLNRLREACLHFSMDAADEILEELERYDYEYQADMVVWLRERIDRVEFAEVLEKLPLPS